MCFGAGAGRGDSINVLSLRHRRSQAGRNPHGSPHLHTFPSGPRHKHPKLDCFNNNNRDKKNTEARRRPEPCELQVNTKLTPQQPRPKKKKEKHPPNCAQRGHVVVRKVRNLPSSGASCGKSGQNDTKKKSSETKTVKVRETKSSGRSRPLPERIADNGPLIRAAPCAARRRERPARYNGTPAHWDMDAPVLRKSPRNVLQLAPGHF